MDIKEPATKLCGVCQETWTNHTLEVRTRKGRTVSFPCCVNCRGVTSRLADTRQEMDVEEAMIKKLHNIESVVLDSEARVYQDGTNRSTTHHEQSYKQRRVAKARTVESLNNVLEALSRVTLGVA